MEVYLTALRDLVNNSGFSVLFSSMGTGNLVMLVVALVLLYLAIVKGFEPNYQIGRASCRERV